jgi:hypothetical protein
VLLLVHNPLPLAGSPSSAHGQSARCHDRVCKSARGGKSRPVADIGESRARPEAAWPSARHIARSSLSRNERSPNSGALYAGIPSCYERASERRFQEGSAAIMIAPSQIRSSRGPVRLQWQGLRTPAAHAPRTRSAARRCARAYRSACDRV